VHQIIVVDRIGELLYDGLKLLNCSYKYQIYCRDYNEEDPWVISFKTQAVEMDELSFNKK
jgi:hypothetical protein